jgi:FtsP/CotA-like multicopper oxidase with cupredoxin domain
MNEDRKTRREFLTGSAIASAFLLGGCNHAGTPSGSATGESASGVRADVTLHIGTVLADIAKGHTISTLGYNGLVPGPLIRLREGVPVTVGLFNDTDTPEFVHWHGQIVPAAVDGAAEENSFAVPPHGHIQYHLTPQPAGARFVHTHVMSMDDTCRGTYTGQFAFVYIEPKENPGRYDQEVFLATHEFEPFFGAEEMDEGDEDEETRRKTKEAQQKQEKPNGWEIGYQRFTINGKCLGYGEPVRVKEGQRVLFHILNASATENIQLALPGHQFQVIALDGNPVPQPRAVEGLELGTAERISAVVEMKNPGVWILGTPHDDDRKNGMGIVVEYANRSGAPQWVKPAKHRWDYTIFGANGGSQPAAAETIPLVFGKINGGQGGFNRWTINGKSFDEKAAPTALQKGKRYRLVFDNQTDDAHPIHLHRNSFELTSVDGKPTAGILKDVVLVKGFKKIEVDVTPAMDGLTLFHCHQQLHMDYGFKLLFNVV